MYVTQTGQSLLMRTQGPKCLFKKIRFAGRYIHSRPCDKDYLATPGVPLVVPPFLTRFFTQNDKQVRYFPFHRSRKRCQAAHFYQTEPRTQCKCKCSLERYGNDTLIISWDRMPPTMAETGTNSTPHFLGIICQRFSSCYRL